MNNNLELTSYIDKSRLNKRQYFKSLLDEAEKCGLADQYDCEKIATQLIELLWDICNTISEKGSSSMRAEEVEEISKSILYTVSVRLKKCASPEKALEKIKQESVETVFRQGKEEIRSMLTLARGKWAVIAKELFQTPNAFYKSTAIDGMKAFFQNYDMNIGAHKNIILCDYPLYLEDRDLEGIEFIGDYLSKFKCENRFLKSFESESVDALLCCLDPYFPGMGEKAVYRTVPVNLYSSVLACALGLALIGRSAQSLYLTKEQSEKIADMLYQKEYADIVRTLDAAAGTLCYEISADEELRLYIRQSVRKLAAEISKTPKNALSALFLAQSENEQTQSLTLEQCERMSDADFRALISQAQSCQSTHKKLTLLQESIKSADDFADAAYTLKLTKEEILSCIGALDVSQILSLLYFNSVKRCFDGEEYRSLSQAIGEYHNGLPEEYAKKLDVFLQAAQNAQNPFFT